MTRFHMMLVSPDRSLEPVEGTYTDLDAACRKAFQIAEEAARPGWSTSGAKPMAVSVYRDNAFELSIEVAQDRGTKVVTPRPSGGDVDPGHQSRR